MAAKSVSNNSFSKDRKANSPSAQLKAYELQKTFSSPEFPFKKILRNVSQHPEARKNESASLSSSSIPHSPSVHASLPNKKLTSGQPSSNKAYRSGSGPLILQRSTKSPNLDFRNLTGETSDFKSTPSWRSNDKHTGNLNSELNNTSSLSWLKTTSSTKTQPHLQTQNQILPQTSSTLKESLREPTLTKATTHLKESHPILNFLPNKRNTSNSQVAGKPAQKTDLSNNNNNNNKQNKPNLNLKNPILDRLDNKSTVLGCSESSKTYSPTTRDQTIDPLSFQNHSSTGLQKSSTSIINHRLKDNNRVTSNTCKVNPKQLPPLPSKDSLHSAAKNSPVLRNSLIDKENSRPHSVISVTPLRLQDSVIQNEASLASIPHIKESRSKSTQQVIPQSQRKIREEQEKKLLELHEKNQQEIFQLRSQDPDFPAPGLARSSSLGSREPLALASKRNRSATLQRLPPVPKLNRSNTYDNAPSTSQAKPLCGILKESSQYGSNSSIQVGESQTQSFSGYLTRTRSKDSLSSKGNSSKASNSDIAKEDSFEAGHKILSHGPKSLAKGSYSSILKSPHRLTRPKKVEFKEPETFDKNGSEKNGKQNKVDVSPKKAGNSPTKPPRGEKSSKRSNGNTYPAEREVMKHQKVDSRVSKDPSQQEPKQSFEPKTHPQLQRSNYQNPPPKIDVAHERRSSQTEHAKESKVTDKYYHQEKCEPTEQSPVPPARGIKQSSKPATSQVPTQTSVRRRTEPKCGPESILITACRVAEEDQVMRLLRDLAKNPAVFDANLINEVDISGRTALSHSCSNGFYRVVEFLTSQTDIDLNLPDSEGSTPLHYAAQGGHVEIVSHLVNTCSRQVDLDSRNSLGFTPLMKAALQGRTKIAKILLFAGASPHLRDYGRGLCALEWAKYTGRTACSDLIESVQRSCSSHIRDRWTSDPDLKLYSGSGGPLSQHQYGIGGPNDNKDSWLKHKIKKAFNKSDSKKEFSVATNLSNLAACVSSPLVPCQPQTGGESSPLPKVQVTEVSAPDCYFDPGESLSSPSSDDYSSGEVSPNSSTPTSPEDMTQVFNSEDSAPVTTEDMGDLNYPPNSEVASVYNRVAGGYRGFGVERGDAPRKKVNGHARKKEGFAPIEGKDRFDF